ncbi:DNA-binding protein [Orbaceae bacterium ESL0727]|nr:DNA-binding protein [Orbaceae bacterium ESL0727]MDF7667983.1 DNA-binding protein [Orbaceae bacterium ESL0727]
MTTKVLTPAQVKQQFHQKGLTFKQWAHDNGYHPVDVYRVTNGFTKASRGKMHEIAVKLGLKQTV